MSTQAHADGPEAPLTRRDMRGFLADFRSSVAEELDKRLNPILENMADLTARTQAVEDNMAEVQNSVHTHEGALQDLRDQLRALEDANEDLSNRTRRNNIRDAASSKTTGDRDRRHQQAGHRRSRASHT
ncbi:Hypothetical predicted protein [Pelobates cultripes]|uniref:Uncharacterized protein n=1 Tax=Pelobates cultripes TaxID=61616 RepID=A0AAD1VZG9_PELCU|nr:Hypothetical predicted protein [Pelobates cultripes]